MAKKAQDNIKHKSAELYSKPGDPKIGPVSSKIKIVEFFDYACGFCKEMSSVMDKVLKEYPDVQIIFKEAPMFGNNSIYASKVALAINKLYPDKYHQFYSKVFTIENRDFIAGIPNILKQLNIGDDVIKAMSDPEFETTISENRRLAYEVGIRGAPAFIINDKLVTGALDYDKFKMLIEEAKAAGMETSDLAPQASESNAAPEVNRLRTDSKTNTDQASSTVDKAN